MLTLYQFPISHFCEKARWALDYKQVDYKVRNILPGLHTLKTKKIAAHSSVPILVHDDKVIQNSNDIITYLDEMFPQHRLTPKDNLSREEALEWETYLGKEIGVHLRRCFYHILLDYPDIVIPFFTHNGPWYGKIYLRFMYPKLKIRMHERMKVNDDTAQESLEHLRMAIEKLHSHYQEHEFLVGDQFTRADLTAASLLAPLHKPGKYGLDWPERLPEKLEVIIDKFEEQTQWVVKFYKKFR